MPIPDVQGEALVRVLKSGICNTDLEIARGYAGFEGTIGHEFVGVVERAEDEQSLIGKRVVGEINAGWGVCPPCLSGGRSGKPQKPWRLSWKRSTHLIQSRCKHFSVFLGDVLCFETALSL